MVFEINLLPEKYRKRKITIRVDTRLLGIITGIAIVALVGWITINQGIRMTALEREAQDLEAQKSVLEPTALRVDQYRGEIESLQQRIRTLQGLGQRNNVQLQILEIVRTQLPDDLWLLDLNQIARQQQRPGAGISAGQVLNFRGVALYKERVIELIARLKAQELIQRVQTNFIRPRRVEEVDIFEFALTAVLNVSG